MSLNLTKTIINETISSSSSIRTIFKMKATLWSNPLFTLFIPMPFTEMIEINLCYVSHSRERNWLIGFFFFLEGGGTGYERSNQA